MSLSYPFVFVFIFLTTVRTSKNLQISDQSGGCKNLEVFERRKEGETVVRWGTCVHGRLPIPNLLFSIFFPLFLHLKLAYFTRERLDESLPHVRDFFTSETPTSRPQWPLWPMFSPHNRGRHTTLVFQSNRTFWRVRTLAVCYVWGIF